MCFAPRFVTMEAVKVADGVPLFSNLDRYFGCDRNLTPTLKAVGIWFLL
jgi:hypothetical protein